jgi:hypothetical protein
MALLDLYTEWLTKRMTNRWFPEWNNAHQGVLRLSDRLNGYLAMQRVCPGYGRLVGTQCPHPLAIRNHQLRHFRARTWITALGPARVKTA